MSPVNFQKTIKSQAEAIVMQWPTKIFKICGKVKKRHCYVLETWNKDASRLIAWSKSPAPRTSIIIRNRCGKTHDHCCQWKKIWGRFNLHLIAHCNPTQFIQLNWRRRYWMIYWLVEKIWPKVVRIRTKKDQLNKMYRMDVSVRHVTSQLYYYLLFYYKQLLTTHSSSSLILTWKHVVTMIE